VVVFCRSGYDGSPEKLELKEQWEAKAKEDILEEMEQAKKNQPSWTAALPLVKVILSRSYFKDK
jgi:hypothetical protein